MLPRYRDLIKNLILDDFYDDLSETLSEGTLRPGARNILATPFNKTYRV